MTAEHKDSSSVFADPGYVEKAVATFDGEFRLRPAESLLIEEFFPSTPARILDLGCGNGRTTVPLHEKGYDVTGLDVCEPLIRIASDKRPDVKYVVGDARRLQFADQSFDAVFFSWNGIDYMRPFQERLDTLREIWRVLKPGGRFLFSSHNALGVTARLFKPVALTAGALGFIRDQFPLCRDILRWYFNWPDPGIGTLPFYSAPPSINQRALKREGWSVLAIRSDVRPESAPRVLADVHVQYVCERPE